MKALKEKFDNGYEIRTFSKITNSKGITWAIQESMSLKDVERLQLKIMLDVKKAVLEFEKRIKSENLFYSKNNISININDLDDLIKETFGEFDK